MSDTAELAALGIRPPPQSVINLAYANTAISAIFLPIALYNAWRHGKPGMVCWAIFVSTPVASIVAGVYQIIKKDELMIPNAVTTMTTSAVVACITLTMIGSVYMCNTMLPTTNKNMKQKLLLGATHLFQTGGIGVATYAGAPDKTGEGGVKNKKLNGIGTLIILWVLFATCAWMWPTFNKIRRYSALGHPNAAPARWMLFAAGAAMPFWLIRLAYVVTYAFDHIPSLDPVTGSFAVKLLLLFGTYVSASIALLVGGWLGVRKAPPGTAEEYENSDGIEMMGQRVKVQV